MSANIHHQIVSVYGDMVSRDKIAVSYREFKDGRTNSHSSQRNRRPSIVTEEFVEKLKWLIHEDYHLTVDELHKIQSNCAV